MLPPDEGFGADDRPVVARNDGLIVGSQFARVDRRAQFGGFSQARCRGVLEVGGERHERRVRKRCFVEGKPRCGDRIVGGASVARDAAEAGFHRRKNIAAFNRERRAERLDDP